MQIHFWESNIQKYEITLNDLFYSDGTKIIMASWLLYEFIRLSHFPLKQQIQLWLIEVCNIQEQIEDLSVECVMGK